MNNPLDQLRLRFTGLRPLAETSYGQVYAGADFTGEVTVVVLSEQAAADPAVRKEFAGVVAPQPGRAAATGAAWPTPHWPPLRAALCTIAASSPH